eukprot:TRINITY_DN8116_c0_g1_i1.p2 TRINITY_DN8116_c0_g1~~TRINITY_DN8116_c0_g1_i1.p2  ORF type:complete len:267 (+),score=55.72 TRINITY_DN8116_c0_g1_i1:1100-1900(+)
MFVPVPEVESPHPSRVLSPASKAVRLAKFPQATDERASNDDPVLGMEGSERRRDGGRIAKNGGLGGDSSRGLGREGDEDEGSRRRREEGDERRGRERAGNGGADDEPREDRRGSMMSSREGGDHYHESEKDSRRLRKHTGGGEGMDDGRREHYDGMETERRSGAHRNGGFPSSEDRHRQRVGEREREEEGSELPDASMGTDGTATDVEGGSVNPMSISVDTRPPGNGGVVRPTLNSSDKKYLRKRKLDMDVQFGDASHEAGGGQWD